MSDTRLADMSPFERHMSQMIDGAFYSAVRGATNSNAVPEAPVTVDTIVASMKDALEKLGPPPPQIRESYALTDTVEDWSGVRAPSRAIRRRKRGFRQNIRFVQVPKPDAYVIDGVMYVHPVTLARARANPLNPNL